MSHNKFSKSTENKFGRIPNRRSGLNAGVEETGQEVISPFDIPEADRMVYNETFNSAINKAVPIWEMLNITEEKYNETYNPTPAAAAVEEELKEEIYVPMPSVVED